MKGTVTSPDSSISEPFTTQIRRSVGVILNRCLCTSRRATVVILQPVSIKQSTSAPKSFILTYTLALSIRCAPRRLPLVGVTASGFCSDFSGQFLWKCAGLPHLLHSGYRGIFGCFGVQGTFRVMFTLFTSFFPAAGFLFTGFVPTCFTALCFSFDAPGFQELRSVVSALNVISAILYSIRCRTGSQCRSASTGLM